MKNFPAGWSGFRSITSPYYDRERNDGIGTIRRFENFTSKYVQARNVDVWLPVDYSPSKKYAVLYMHDGQMLFDSTSTWNKQDWNVDETVSLLASGGKIRNVIVVGIWNNGNYRHSEYFPQRCLSYLPAGVREVVVSQLLAGKPRADNYLSFITQELKPFIDKAFSTSADRGNTFIAGSSMGGLISLYGLCEYPDVFGGAACLSTHWPGYTQLRNNQIPEAVAGYLLQKLPSARNHTIYFDYGTRALDSLYKPYQQKVDNIMKVKGYNNTNWTTKEFEGDDHSENAWSRRFHIPLQFLLGEQHAVTNDIKPAGNVHSCDYDLHP